MDHHNRIFKGTATVGLGEAVTYGCSFVRNIIIARLLTTVDMGIAATLALTVSMLQMASNLSLERLIVQSKDGEDPRFQATLQTFQAIRGLLISVLLFGLAGPITSGLFKVPEAKKAFQFLAVVPLLQGFIHFDMHRAERQMRFLRVVCVQTIPQIAITLAAWPAIKLVGNYSIVVWLLFWNHALVLLGSHFCGHRCYRLGWDSTYASHVFVFGWPLIINGLLLYAVMNGDRLIVGAAYGMENLGVYSVAAMLAMTPAFLLLKVVGSIMLPLLSRAQEDREEFERRYSFCTQTLCLISACVAVCLVVSGGPLILLVYGSKYASAGILIGWLGVMQALRIVRAAPTVAAMAKGDTKNLMISNMARTAALGLALLATALHLPLYTMAICGAIGEIFSLTVSVSRLWRRHHLPALSISKPVLFVIGVMGLAGLVNRTFLSGRPWTYALLWTLLLCVMVFGLTVILFRQFRIEVWDRLVGHILQKLGLRGEKKVECQTEEAPQQSPPIIQNPDRLGGEPQG